VYSVAALAIVNVSILAARTIRHSPIHAGSGLLSAYANPLTRSHTFNITPTSYTLIWGYGPLPSPENQ